MTIGGSPVERSLDAHRLLTTCLILALFIAGVFIFLPFVLLSTYPFTTFDDIYLYTNTQEHGFFGASVWYYTWSIGRYAAILVITAYAELAILLNTGPLYWFRTWPLFSFAIFLGCVYLYFRTLFVRVPRLALLGALGLFVTLFYLAPYKAPNEPLWPWVISLYGGALGGVALLLAATSALITEQKKPGARGFFFAALLYLFALNFFLGYHELSLVGGGLLLALLFFVITEPVGKGVPVSRARVLGFLRIRRAIQLDFDTRAFLIVFVLAAVSYVISAWLQLQAPSVTARSGYWPANYGLFTALWLGLGGVLEVLAGLWANAGSVFLVFLTAVLAASLQRPDVHARQFRKFVVLSGGPLFVMGWVGIALNYVMIGNLSDRMIHYTTGLTYLYIVGIGYCVGSLVGPASERAATIIRTVALGACALMALAIFDHSSYREAFHQAYHEGRDFGTFSDSVMEKLAAGEPAPEIAEPPSWVQPVVHFSDVELFFQERLAMAFGQEKIQFTPCSFSDEPAKCHYRENPQPK